MADDKKCTTPGVFQPQEDEYKYRSVKYTTFSIGFMNPSPNPAHISQTITEYEDDVICMSNMEPEGVDSFTPLRSLFDHAFDDSFCADSYKGGANEPPTDDDQGKECVPPMKNINHPEK